MGSERIPCRVGRVLLGVGVFHQMNPLPMQALQFDEKRNLRNCCVSCLALDAAQQIDGIFAIIDVFEIEGIDDD